MATHSSPVDRAFAVLRAAAAGPGSTLSEIARATGLPKSTTLRLLLALERNAAVTRVGDSYRLGAITEQLDPIPASPPFERIRTVLTPFLAQLFEATRVTVHLATLHGDEVVYLNKLHGPRPIPSPSRIGGGLPAYCTGVGKAMLAFDAGAAARVSRGVFVPWTPTTLRGADELAVELAEIRRRRRAIDRAELTEGLYCVAAPVLDGDGRPVAALSASAADQSALRRLEPVVLRVAAAAGRELGVQEVGHRECGDGGGSTPVSRPHPPRGRGESGVSEQCPGTTQTTCVDAGEQNRHRDGGPATRISG